MVLHDEFLSAAPQPIGAVCIADVVFDVDVQICVHLNELKDKVWVGISAAQHDCCSLGLCLLGTKKGMNGGNRW